MDSFVDNGWEFGGHADAAAKAGDKGGDVNAAGDISSGMEIYQVTEAGLALQATVSAAKYSQKLPNCRLAISMKSGIRSSNCDCWTRRSVASTRRTTESMF